MLLHLATQKKNPPTFSIFRCLQPFQIFHLSEKKKLKHEIKDKKNSPKTIHYRENSLSEFFCRATSIIIFLSNTTQKGEKMDSIQTQHFCHKQKKNHQSHDNSTPASNVITSKQVSSAPWNSRKQERNCSGMALDGRLAHILQANSFFATICFFWNFRHQLAIFPPPIPKSRKSKYFYSKEIEWWVKVEVVISFTGSTSCIQYSHASNKLAVVKDYFWTVLLILIFVVSQ